jgi:hypothetical protein
MSNTLSDLLKKMAIIHFSIFLIAYDLNAWVIMDDATQEWWVPT